MAAKRCMGALLLLLIDGAAPTSTSCRKPNRVYPSRSGHVNRHRRRRLPRLAPLRAAARQGRSRHLHRQPRHGVASEHRAHRRRELHLHQPRPHRAVLRSTSRSTSSTTWPRPRARSTTCACRSTRSRSAPRARTTCSASRSSSARASCSPRPPRSTATPRSIRSPRSYWGHVNPIGPRGVYDEAKRYAEALTMAYHRQQGVDTCIVADLQHLRPADAPARRPRDPDLPAPGAPGQAADRLRRRQPDPQLLLRR